MALGNFNTLLDNVLDLVDGHLDGLRIGGCYVGVQRLILPGQRLTVLSANFSLFDGPFSANDDLRARVPFHGLERVASGPDEQTHEIDIRMLLLGNHNLIVDFNHGRLIIRRRFVVRVEADHGGDGVVTRLLQLFALAIFTRVETFPVRGVNRLGRRRPEEEQQPDVSGPT